MRVSRPRTARARRRLLPALLLCFGATGPLTAQDAPDPPSTTTNAHLAELDYLLGEWKVRSFTRSETSEEWTESPSPSWYRARRLRDGRSILAEFYEDDPGGFYGVHLISRDAEGGLVHWYLNAKADRRLEFSGRREADAYHLTRRGGYGGGDFIYRETDSSIGPDAFEKDVFRSDDDGATWTRQGYRFRFERVEPRTGG